MELLERTESKARTEMRARTRLGQKGRVVIPAPMREALGVDAGGVLELRMVDGELRISSIRSRIQRAQALASRYVKPGTLVSEELSAERREAAKHE
jgi:AbrB family looped-hinge helix DNA binding protein